MGLKWQYTLELLILREAGEMLLSNIWSDYLKQSFKQAGDHLLLLAF